LDIRRSNDRMQE